MNKEEILEKSRKAGVDEMQKKVEDNASSCGLLAVLALTLILTLYKIFNHMPYQDMMSLVFAQMSAGGFYKFVKLKTKIYLFVGILGGILSLLNALTFMLGLK